MTYSELDHLVSCIDTGFIKLLDLPKYTKIGICTMNRSEWVMAGYAGHCQGFVTVQLISKGSVRLAKKGFSHINNDYSITLNEDAEIVPVNGNENDIQSMKYKFVKIANIEQMEAKSFVDVLGIVVDIQPLEIWW